MPLSSIRSGVYCVLHRKKRRRRGNIPNDIMVITMIKKVQSALLISFAVQAGDARLRQKQQRVVSIATLHPFFTVTGCCGFPPRIFIGTPSKQKSNPGESNAVKNIQIMSASLHITWADNHFGQCPHIFSERENPRKIPISLIYFMTVQVYTHIPLIVTYTYIRTITSN